MDEFTDTDGAAEHSGAREHGGSRVAELERELDRKDARIQALERQLSEARDLEQLADRLYRAVLDRTPDGEGPTDQSQRATDGADDDPDEILLDSLDEDVDEPKSDDDPGMTAADALGGDGFTSPPEPSPTPMSGDPTPDPATDTPVEPEREPTPDDQGQSDPGVVGRLRTEIESLSVVEREMLRHYREHGPTTPPAAHQAVGGSGTRTEAYAANRALRTRGLVEHAARGRHRYTLPDLIAEATGDPLSPGDGPSSAVLDRLVQAVEASFVHDVQHPSIEPDPDAPNQPAFGDDLGAWPDA